MKKMWIAALAASVLLTESLTVSAAGVKDIFDAEYYTEKYADLETAFGDNETKPYEHFMTYGAEEGRDNGTDFDVMKYLNTNDNFSNLPTSFFFKNVSNKYNMHQVSMAVSTNENIQ